ncbi:MAG: hypothetical protein ACKVOE_04845 [Rickettsiales bacterium]
MAIDQTKVDEFVTEYKAIFKDLADKAIDPSMVGSRWYSLEQFRKMAEGETTPAYTFPPKSWTTTDMLRTSRQFLDSPLTAEQLRDKARAAGLNCDIISYGGGHDPQTLLRYGSWNLNMHGRETLEALAKAGLTGAATALEGKQKGV